MHCELTLANIACCNYKFLMASFRIAFMYCIDKGFSVLAYVHSKA